MKTNQVNETKERKSFKEVLVENKGKIITGVGAVSAVAIGYLCYKNKIEISKAFMKVKAKDKLNEFVMEELWYKAEATPTPVIILPLFSTKTSLKDFLSLVSFT